MRSQRRGKSRDQAVLPLPEERQEPARAVPTLVPDLEKIRGFVAANGRGMTRDEVILEEITKLLHAKVHDEITSRSSRTEPRFFAAPGERDSAIRGRIDDLLREAGRAREGEDSPSPIALDDASLRFAVEVLESRRLRDADRDVVGEAYESLIFPSLRGGQGQFFTPKNVARCLAGLVSIQKGNRVIDPACGTGGFLLEAARATPGVTLVGVDKDSLLARLAADSLNLQAGGAAVTCANSLLPARDQRGSARELLEPSSYDVVITNPPFGSKIPVEGELLRDYELAYQWTQDRKSRTWARTQTLRDSAPPQILFIELCWKLLREGGRCGIVLPEGILGNQSAGYIRQWLIERADILAVVDCPLETFMPSTSTKTTIVVFEKRSKLRRPPVFMAIAEKCGHDRRGTPLLRADGSPEDDFSLIVEEWKRHRNATSQGAAA